MKSVIGNILVGDGLAVRRLRVGAVEGPRRGPLVRGLHHQRDRELNLVCERADPDRPYGCSQVRGRCGLLLRVSDARPVGRHDLHPAGVLKAADHRRGRLKAAARVLHQRLTVLADGLDRVSTFWPAAEVAIGHNMIAHAHRGVRGVVLSGAWTVAGKLVFMQLTGLGPLDVTNPGEFFERIEEVEVFADPAERADPRVLWVNPDTGIRVNLKLQWASGAVDTSTPTILSRMAPETTDLTDYIGGAWIDDIN